MRADWWLAGNALNNGRYFHQTQTFKPNLSCIHSELLARHLKVHLSLTLDIGHYAMFRVHTKPQTQAP